MAALAVFALTLLARDAAGLDAPRRRLPLRRLLLRYSAACTVLGASAIIHAAETSASHALALSGFLLWAGGIALLLLAFTAERFPAASRRAAQVVEAAVAAFF